MASNSVVLRGLTNNDHLKVSNGAAYIRDYLSYDQIAMGNATGYTAFSLYASTTTLNEDNSPKTIWDITSNYVFSETADITTISSSSTSDTVQNVAIIGLDENWEEVTQLVALSGQNEVTLGVPLLRVNQVVNYCADPLSGNVYVYTDGAAVTGGVPTDLSTVRGYVAVGKEVSQMGVYSVPAGKVLYNTTFIVGAFLNSANPTTATFVSVNVWARPFGLTFRESSVTQVNTTGAPDASINLVVPNAIDEKTDVHLMASSGVATTVGCGVFANGFTVDKTLTNLGG